MTRRDVALVAMILGVVILTLSLTFAFGWLAGLICIGAAFVLISILIGWT